MLVECVLVDQVVDDPLLRAFALTNLVRSKDGEGMKWKIGIRQIRRNLGIIGGFDLGQGLQRPASDLDLQVHMRVLYLGFRILGKPA